MTSNAPGSGTSISSIWKASFGSPSRSSRITHAAIVSGSVPGSTFTSVTSRVAMREDSPPVRSAGGWYLGDAACRVMSECHHGQLRVHPHGRREHARIRHVEVLEAVDAEVA